MKPYEVWRRQLSMQAAGGDPYWSDVVALLNMAGPDGSTTFTDSTGLRTWSVNGGVEIDDSFGFNAARFPGAPGDLIYTPYVKEDFDWWTGEYTVEAWVSASSYDLWYYVDGNTKSSMIGCADPASTTNYWSFGPVGGGEIAFYYFNGSGGQRITTGGLSAGSLQHIAFMNTLEGIQLAVNGTLSGPVSIVGAPVSSESGVVMTFGQINARSIAGLARSLRITRARRWSSDFTPPPPPFPVG